MSHFLFEVTQQDYLPSMHCCIHAVYPLACLSDMSICQLLIRQSNARLSPLKG